MSALSVLSVGTTSTVLAALLLTTQMAPLGRALHGYVNDQERAYTSTCAVQAEALAAGNRAAMPTLEKVCEARMAAEVQRTYAPLLQVAATLTGDQAARPQQDE